MRHFRPFEVTELALTYIVDYLLNGRLCVSDEGRTIENIANAVATMFPGVKARADAEWWSLHNADGQLCGVLGFCDIRLGWKARVTIKMWDKSAWGPEAVREAREIIATVMDKYKLFRLNSETADIAVKRMARMVGFCEDGCREKDFVWDGEYYDRWLLGLYRDSEEDDNG